MDTSAGEARDRFIGLVVVLRGIIRDPALNAPSGIWAAIIKTKHLVLVGPLKGGTFDKNQNPAGYPSCPLYPRKRTSVGHRAMSAMCQKRKWSDLFDHLVGADLDRRGQIDPDRLGGLEVDH
jgi:hypothetical protein